MTIPYYITIEEVHDAQIGADGEIEITTTGSYHGEDVERTFTTQDLATLIDYAIAHKAGRDRYEVDYEESDYFAGIAQFGMELGEEVRGVPVMRRVK